MLNIVKTALRIQHEKLDDEITRLIATAKSEMIRVGVIETKINIDESEYDSLIKQAIVTYCLFNLVDDDKKSQRYEESWNNQINNIRNSSGYFYEE